MKASVLTAIAFLTVATPGHAVPGHGVDTKTLDSTVKPADDLYHFANGKWLSQVQIPSDRPGVDAFYEVHEKTQVKVRHIVNGIVSRRDWQAGTVESKIATFYRVYADDAKAEKLGIEPLKPLLQMCQSPGSPKDYVRTVAELDSVGVPALLTTQILSDFGNSQKRMLFFGQASLGLPERDYYLSEEPQMKALRGLYRDHMKRVFLLAGRSQTDAEFCANSALHFEKKLAEISLSSLQQRDIKAQYNPIEFRDFVRKYPDLNWQGFADLEGLSQPGRVSIAAPAYFDRLTTLLSQTPNAEVRNYFRWCVLSAYSGLLNKAFRDEEFKFQAVITGQSKPTPDWRRYLEATSAVFGQPIGKMYVKEAFPGSAKAKAKQLILNLQTAFAQRIKTNEWMGAATKQEALRKLSAITIKVGYPDKWLSYDKLVVKNDSRIANAIRATQFAQDRAIRDYHKPVDRSEWGMTPQTVNAYYNPMNNEIVFPAAILQSPFFDPDADEASNYGGIGMVIGHEMTHGFDDQGRLFDAKGNLREWWTKEDDTKFSALKQRLIDQYDKYTVNDSVKVNGALTVGENIADLGGVHIAYDALQIALRNKPTGSIDGFTPQQRFFLSLAQVWRFKASPQYVELLAKIDTHSPSALRPIGALVNVPEFVEAFGASTKSMPTSPGSGNLRIW